MHRKLKRFQQRFWVYWAIPLSIGSLSWQAICLADEPMSIVVGNRGSCYKEAQTHFFNPEQNPSSKLEPPALGAAYISVQNGFSYAVIDNGHSTSASQSGAADRLKNYFSANRRSDFINCGSVPRCGGGSASVCVVKISDHGEFLPVQHTKQRFGTLRIEASIDPKGHEKYNKSSVEFFPDSGHLRIVDAPELYDTLRGLPSVDLKRKDGKSPRYLSFDVERKSPQMSCSQIGMTGGSVDQQCDFNLGMIVGLNPSTQTPTETEETLARFSTLPLAMTIALQPAGLGVPSPFAPEPRLLPTSNEKYGTAPQGGFACPAGWKCDEPVLSPGDPGYGGAR